MKPPVPNPDPSVARCVAAAASVPAGRWGVGVSGGADSVALLRLLRIRPDLTLHVIHLDHETRSGESAKDAAFTAELARQLGISSTLARLSEVEQGAQTVRNRSARYRRARLSLFASVARSHDLLGVVLAHHADDQAETTLHRLLRGSSAAGLAGMAPVSYVRGVSLHRPLLNVRRGDLRALLAHLNQRWREDASNADALQARNRLRLFLADRPAVVEALLAVASNCEAVRTWVQERTPDAEPSLEIAAFLALPAPVRRSLAGRWLTSIGVPRDRIEPDVLARLHKMITNGAAAARQDFPGNISVERRRGHLALCDNSPARRMPTHKMKKADESLRPPV